MDRIDLMAERRPDLWPLRDKIRTMGTDNLSHFGNQYTHEGGYSLQQNPDEFACLTLLLCERSWGLGGPGGGTYLEIGSASGGALRWFHEEVRFNRYLAMDDGGHHRAPEQDRNFLVVDSSCQQQVELFHGNSHSDEAKRWLEDSLSTVFTSVLIDGTELGEVRGPPTRVDVAFIDGDHSYEGVAQDVQLVRPHLRPGSLVIFHDTIACEGVKRVWDECTAFAERIAHYTGTERPLGIGVAVVR